MPTLVAASAETATTLTAARRPSPRRGARLLIDTEILLARGVITFGSGIVLSCVENTRPHRLTALGRTYALSGARSVQTKETLGVRLAPIRSAAVQHGW